MQRMQGNFLGKFGQNLGQFGQIWLNLSKFGQNLGKFGIIIG